MRIFLIGFMGCGKTTVGRLLSDEAGEMMSAPMGVKARAEPSPCANSGKLDLLGDYRFVDMDSEIEKRDGAPVREIFARRGEHHFRNLEAKLLDELCLQDNVIVSCGGGIIHDEQNVKQLKENGPAVFLKADAKTLFERVKNDPNRPFAFLDGGSEEERFVKFSVLYKRRMPLYEKAASYTVSVDGKTPDEISEEIKGIFL